MNLDYFQSTTGNNDVANSVLISLNKSKNIDVNKTSITIEKEFNKKGIIEEIKAILETFFPP